MSDEYVTREELAETVKQEVQSAMVEKSEPVEVVTIGDRDYPADEHGYPVVADDEFWSITEIRNAWFPGQENSRGGKLPAVFNWVRLAGVKVLNFSSLGDPDDRDAEHSPAVRGLLNADYEKLRAFKVRTERERVERIAKEHADVIAGIREQKRRMAEAREAHRAASIACAQARGDAENIRKRAYDTAQRLFDETYAANNAEADRIAQEAGEAAIVKNDAAQQDFGEAQYQIAEDYRATVEAAEAAERAVMDAHPLYL